MDSYQNFGFQFTYTVIILTILVKKFYHRNVCSLNITVFQRVPIIYETNSLLHQFWSKFLLCYRSLPSVKHHFWVTFPQITSYHHDSCLKINRFIVMPRASTCIEIHNYLYYGDIYIFVIISFHLFTSKTKTWNWHMSTVDKSSAFYYKARIEWK